MLFRSVVDVVVGVASGLGTQSGTFTPKFGRCFVSVVVDVAAVVVSPPLTVVVVVVMVLAVGTGYVTFSSSGCGTHTGMFNAMGCVFDVEVVTLVVAVVAVVAIVVVNWSRAALSGGGLTVLWIKELKKSMCRSNSLSLSI